MDDVTDDGSRNPQPQRCLVASLVVVAEWGLSVAFRRGEPVKGTMGGTQGQNSHSPSASAQL